MGEMRERVGRALHAKWLETFKASGGSIDRTPFDQLSADDKAFGEGMVDAVLSAMREPTSAMADLLHRYDSHDMGVRNYQAAIDKARADG